MSTKLNTLNPNLTNLIYNFLTVDDQFRFHITKKKYSNLLTINTKIMKVLNRFYIAPDFTKRIEPLLSCVRTQFGDSAPINNTLLLFIYQETRKANKSFSLAELVKCPILLELICSSEDLRTFLKKGSINYNELQNVNKFGHGLYQFIDQCFFDDSEVLYQFIKTRGNHENFDVVLNHYSFDKERHEKNKAMLGFCANLYIDYNSLIFNPYVVEHLKEGSVITMPSESNNIEGFKEMMDKMNVFSKFKVEFGDNVDKDEKKQDDKKNKRNYDNYDDGGYGVGECYEDEDEDMGGEYDEEE